ncbi:MAG: folate-binding protein [Candidatus Nitrotoga sp.]
MNPTWQEFLQRQGAVMHDHIVQNFGDPNSELVATQSGTVLCNLSQFGTLKISGAEAQSFLQNLLSSDVNAVNIRGAQLSSLNSPQGRILASLLIWQSGGDYFLQLPGSLCAATQKRLAMYILRAKVKIENTSTQNSNIQTISFGLAGEHAHTLIQQHFGDVPQSNLVTQPFGHGNIIRLTEQRFQINVTAPHAIELWQKLSAKSQYASAQIVGSPCWDWLQIRAGIPVILPATQEQFVAQMVNLELIGGVSFKKGCYPGQEIVARMQYLGKLKRRMYLAHIRATDHPIPQAGDELFSADMEEQSCGRIVNAAAAPGGGYDVLAVVQISSQESQVIHWQSLQGTTLQFMPLPYPFPKPTDSNRGNA